MVARLLPWLALGLATTAGAMTPPTLGFRPASMVAGASVSLQHIVRIAGTPMPVDWAAIEVASLPFPGMSATLRRADVERALRRAGVAGPLHWQGAETVRITRRGETLPANLLRERAHAHLAAQLGERYRRFMLRPLGAVPVMHGGGRETRIEARLPGSGEAKPRMAVWLEVSGDGAPARSAPVWFAVEAHAPVYVADADIPAGTELATQAVRIEWRDVAGQPGALDADHHSLAGLRARVPLRAGEVLARERVDAMPVVRAGEMVRVEASHGPVRVSGRAVSRQDGRIGDMVRLHSAQSGEPFRGRVTRAGHVEVVAGEIAR